jgi:hypothetical protein
MVLPQAAESRPAMGYHMFGKQYKPAQWRDPQTARLLNPVQDFQRVQPRGIMVSDKGYCLG